MFTFYFQLVCFSPVCQDLLFRQHWTPRRPPFLFSLIIPKSWSRFPHHRRGASFRCSKWMRYRNRYRLLLLIRLDRIPLNTPQWVSIKSAAISFHSSCMSVIRRTNRGLMVSFNHTEFGRTLHKPQVRNVPGAVAHRISYGNQQQPRPYTIQDSR